jgi:hypothetical protein
MQPKLMDFLITNYLYLNTLSYMIIVTERSLCEIIGTISF